MKLSELKNKLSAVTTLTFVQPNGAFVPRHFHITEIGLVIKHFIDCGGAVHQEQTASMQIWVAEDFDHRLKPSGLLNIIDISKKVLGDTDLEIEVEFQTETIGTYKLDFQGENFVLVPKQTDCLAKSNCGVPEKKLELAGAETEGSCCKPGGGCC
jgi:hypothetical protein